MGFLYAISAEEGCVFLGAGEKAKKRDFQLVHVDGLVLPPLGILQLLGNPDMKRQGCDSGWSDYTELGLKGHGGP